MINFGSTTGGKPTYNQRLFYLDFDADVANLATDHAAIKSAIGSTAYVIQSSNWYKKNSNGEWIKQEGPCASAGGGNTPGTGGDVEWGDISDETLDDIGEIEWEPMVTEESGNGEIEWEPMT